MLAEVDLYLVPEKAGLCTPGPGYYCFAICISSINVFLLVWVVAHLGAVCLFLRLNS